MKLTTKGRYAVTAMLDLYINGKNQSVTLADIANRQGISLAYLEQLFAQLKKHKLVQSIRGPGGGYQIANEKGRISVAEIISAVSESIDTTKCGHQGNCQRGNTCLTHLLWTDLSSKIHDFLSSVSLNDLAANPQIQQIAARQIYLSDEDN